MHSPRALALVVTVAIAASCHRKRDDALPRSEGDPAPQLIRESDQRRAALVWYVAGETLQSTPPLTEAFYMALWDDGLVIFRPDWISSELHVAHVDPARVATTVKTALDHISATPKDDRLSLAEGFNDVVWQAFHPDRGAYMLRGDHWTEGTPRYAALETLGAEADYYFFELASEREHADEPRLRWLPADDR